MSLFDIEPNFAMMKYASTFIIELYMDDNCQGA